MRQSAWGTALIPLGIAAVMTPAILLAAGGGGTGDGFDAVVHGIESRYHAHATHIPFMGLISGIAGISTHGGVHGMHVAEIEGLDGPVDGAELTALVAKHAGAGWQQMIRETSRSNGHDGGEQSLIYVRPEGARMGLLIVDLDHHEMNVVEISVNPDRLMDEVREHVHARHDEDREPGKTDKDASE